MEATALNFSTVRPIFSLSSAPMASTHVSKSSSNASSSSARCSSQNIERPFASSVAFELDPPRPKTSAATVHRKAGNIALNPLQNHPRRRPRPPHRAWAHARLDTTAAHGGAVERGEDGQAAAVLLIAHQFPALPSPRTRASSPSSPRTAATSLEFQKRLTILDVSTREHAVVSTTGRRAQRVVGGAAWQRLDFDRVVVRDDASPVAPRAKSRQSRIIVRFIASRRLERETTSRDATRRRERARRRCAVEPSSKASVEGAPSGTMSARSPGNPLWDKLRRHVVTPGSSDSRRSRRDERDPSTDSDCTAMIIATGTTSASVEIDERTTGRRREWGARRTDARRADAGRDRRRWRRNGGEGPGDEIESARGRRWARAGTRAVDGTRSRASMDRWTPVMSLEGGCRRPSRSA